MYPDSDRKKVISNKFRPGLKEIKSGTGSREKNSDSDPIKRIQT